MNIYRVHCTVPPPFSKLQWQRWPPSVPRRSFYPPFSALSHPLSSALFAPLLLALRMALFLLHLLTRFASSPSWFCARPLSSHLFARPFRSFFFLPSSSPFPLCFRPLLFCFRPSLSAFALFVCIGAITVAHLGDISKKGRLVTDERMTCSAEGAAVGAHCALARHYAKRVCLE